MKKVIYLLVLTLFASNVTAVNNATGPNKVYIEQVGSSNVLTLEQVGGTNNIGGVGGTVTVSNTDNSTTITPDAPSSTNYAYINGATNTITINQHGDNNWAQYSIRGNNNQYTSNVTGSNNKTKLVLGDLTTNNLRNVINQTITGNLNFMYQTLLGNDITTTTTVTGNSNQVTQTLNTSLGTDITTISGNSNFLFNRQIDVAGGSGHYLKQDITGDYNSITTQQQGTNDTTIDIKTTGSHNTLTVRTSSSAIVNAETAIAR